MNKAEKEHIGPSLIKTSPNLRMINLFKIVQILFENTSKKGMGTGKGGVTVCKFYIFLITDKKFFI